MNKRNALRLITTVSYTWGRRGDNKLKIIRALSENMEEKMD